MAFALVSERVVTDDGVGPAAVVVDGERISAVVAPADVPDGAVVHDLGSSVLMPGIVDCHVHVNEPGRTQWEGFVTATQAAAAGGVTTIVDMPLNCIPVTTSVAALHTKLEACRDELWVDTGFWGGVVPGNVAELIPLAEAGVLGCKAFMVHSGIDEFPDATEDDLRLAMPRLREAGIPLLAHAELELPSQPHQHDPRSYRSWLVSRPKAWEDAAIELLVQLCRETGCAVHVVHLSSAASIDTLRRARQQGLPITVETCAHYLCFVAEQIPDGATEYKCAPPIREADNREALWRGLAEGVIDFVITDHSPCTPGLKARDDGDFLSAWGGVASLQLGLPGVWTEAHRRGHDIADLARWLCTNPARFAGLPDRKGRIAPGLDADLVAWDPDATFTVETSTLRFRHKISPYLGRTLRGVVQHTWLRGRPVVDDGRLSETPLGRPLLHRAQSTFVDRRPPPGSFST